MRKFSKDAQTDKSLRHSTYDGMAFAAMSGGGETYFTAFALFLKATSSQIAIISTLPALIGSLAQLAAIWLDDHIPRRKPLIIFGATLQACIWIPIAMLALLVTDHAIAFLLLLLTVYFAAGNLTTPPWISLMGDIVPESKRGRYFAYRTAMISIVTFASLAITGILLNFSEKTGFTWLGFSVVFTMMFFYRMVSVYHLGAMHEPELHHGTQMQTPDLEFLSRNHALWFSAYFILMQLAVAIASPFFAVYMLEVLKFSYFEFMVNTGTVVLMQFITLNWWGRISDIFGNRLILTITGIIIPMMPVLWIVSDNFWYLLCIQALAGLAWGGFNLSAGNLLYDLVPAKQRTTYVAVHNVLAAFGVFIGGMAGAILLHWVPAQYPWLGSVVHATPLLSVFLISTLARAVVSGIFLRKIRELKKPRRSLNTEKLVFRLTRFNAFLGIRYEPVATVTTTEDNK